MAGISKIIRNVTSLIGNVFAWLFDSLFVWLWLSALLIVVAVFIFSAPIQVVGPIQVIGEGGRSLSAIAAAIGGILLVSAGVGWAWYKLGEERAVRLGSLLVRLIVPVAVTGVVGRLWWSWDVPDIWSRPLSDLTLGAIAQNVLKLIILFVGVSFISDVFREIISRWRKG
jgi:hypothetical protein